MAIVFLLFTCFFVNLVGDAPATEYATRHKNLSYPIRYEKLSKPTQVTQNSFIIWGRQTYVMTKQGLLRVSKFLSRGDKLYYRVYWHSKRSPARFFCDKCKVASVSLFDFHFHMNYDHAACLKREGKNEYWCRIGDNSHPTQYKCEHCNQYFESMFRLDEHIIRVHNLRPYIYDDKEG